MTIKLAVQLYSHTMISTIRTCTEINQLKSSTADDTANFIEVVNKLFNGLNSKLLFRHFIKVHIQLSTDEYR